MIVPFPALVDGDADHMYLRYTGEFAGVLEYDFINLDDFHRQRDLVDYNVRRYNTYIYH